MKQNYFACVSCLKYRLNSHRSVVNGRNTTMCADCKVDRHLNVLVNNWRVVWRAPLGGSL